LTALKVTSMARNGVGAYILPCKKLEFHYCDWAGSSKGMNNFLLHILPAFASRSQTISMHVSPRPHRHPVIRAHYVNGVSKAICVKNLSKEQVLAKAQILKDASGIKNFRVRGGRVVRSLNESVRGIWSALHADRLEGGDVWGFKEKGTKRKGKREGKAEVL